MIKAKTLSLLVFTYFLFSISSFAQFEGPVISSIQEANKNPLGVIVLDLSNTYLEEVPDDVFEYKNLQRLRLNRTYIKELPEKIELLTELKALELNHPKEPNLEFKKLPQGVKKLKNLTYIGLIGLPNLDWQGAMSTMLELPNLDNLALMHNDFKNLPDGIDKIKSLRKIWLGGNTELNPAEVFEKLPFIEQVGFGGSQYKELPSNITNASRISNLWLANNQLTSVGVLAGLKELKSLTLNSNELKNLPLEINQLKSLELLSLDNNPEIEWKVLFEHIVLLPNLRQLSLGNNNLKVLPDQLENLAQLKVLILRGNKFEQDEKDRITRMLPDTKVVY